MGAHVLDALLTQGREVRALLRKGSDNAIVERILKHYHADGAERFQRIQWVEGDLFDLETLREAMQGVEHVYHCAALVSYAPRDRKELERVNVEGTANVVNVALAAGVVRLCHVSSTAAVGPPLQGGAIDETRTFVEEEHTSHYAISKARAELEVHRGIAEGLEAVIVNPCVVIGPGSPGRSSLVMMERMRKGGRLYPPGSNAMVDARDVATAMVRLIREGENGERYLLTGENLSYRKLFTLMTASNGKAAPSVALPPWALGLAWRLEAIRSWSGAKPMITRYTVFSATHHRTFDHSKVADLLGMRFRSAEEAVANVAAFLAGRTTTPE